MTHGVEGQHLSCPLNRRVHRFLPLFCFLQTDKAVESWAAHREDIEQTFYYTPKTIAR
jgi:hypothetical protein